MGNKVEIVLDIQAHFEEKITFFWEKREKSIKCPVLYSQFEEKLTFLEFLLKKQDFYRNFLPILRNFGQNLTPSELIFANFEVKK